MPWKLRERALDGFVRDADLERNGNGGQRIEHVVQARQVHGDRQPQAVGAPHHVEVRAQTVAAQVFGAQVGALGEAVTHHRAIHLA